MQDRFEARGHEPLSEAELRWRCRAEDVPFGSTAEVEPLRGVIGQESAVDALRFGLQTRAKGQNVFVRGLTGTGRTTLVRQTLEELKQVCPEARDRCYVFNFSQPDRPRLVTLPAGQARGFRQMVEELADFIRDQLRGALGSESVTESRNAINRGTQERVKKIIEPFEADLQNSGLALVTLGGQPLNTALFPMVNGKPVPPVEFERLHNQGEVSDEDHERYHRNLEAFEERLQEVNRQVHDIFRKHADDTRKVIQDHARSILGAFIAPIANAFQTPAVKQFLDELLQDVVDNRLGELAEEEDFTRIYRVNVLLEHRPNDRCPIIVENTPILTNLLGTLDREVDPRGWIHSDHLMIRGGSLLRADGGFLILDARDVLTEGGSWKVLVRTLRTGRLEIVPPEISLPWGPPTLKPEPIDVDVRVILIGDAWVFHLLDTMDPDFPHLFKVLADFDTTLPRDETGIRYYAGVLAKLAQDEKLPAFDRSAIASLVEHGSRIASRSGKLTARFGRIADLAREGAFLAGENKRAEVTEDDIHEAVRRTKRRADLPSRHFRELVRDGLIRVEMQGKAVGQINGLAVVHSGPLTFGFPARITATIGPGTAGVINIEREAALSGAIHTKGFYILGGLLRHLLQSDHPLAFDASVAFEQSYGGIDGDSASGAEICCLLSALTDVPVRRDLAMTGAIDQVGNILAIGAVNEKIEGYFDVCCDGGLSGTQGVILPSSNTGDLMLRQDVVDACAVGKFSVYTVENVYQALELLTGMPTGTRDSEGKYAEGTFFALAVERARDYWLNAASPVRRVPAAAGEQKPEAGEAERKP